MYIRPYKRDPALLLEDLKSVVPDPADESFAKRVEVVSMVLRGEKSTAQAAKESGASLRSVQGWVRSVDEDGWDSLRTTPPPGRPSRLSEKQQAELKEVLQGNPHAYGYPWWSGANVADYIRNTYGIEYGAGAAQYLIHRLGLRSLLDEKASGGGGSPWKRWMADTTVRKFYSTDVWREQYEHIRPLLENGSLAAKRVHDSYDVFCGCLYVLNTGMGWRNLPDDFPDPNLVWHYWNQWNQPDEEGISSMERCLLRLTAFYRDAFCGNGLPPLAILDTREIRTAYPARAEGEGAGKTASGFNLHLVLDPLGLPYAIHVTPVGTTDTDGVVEMVSRNLEALSGIRLFLGDGSCAGQPFADRIRGLLPHAAVQAVRGKGIQTLPGIQGQQILERVFRWLEPCAFRWEYVAPKPELTRQKVILAFVAALLRGL